MPDRPKCLLCEKNLSIIDIVKEFRYTWIFVGSDGVRERIWSCRKCFLNTQLRLNEAEALVDKVFNGKFGV